MTQRDDGGPYPDDLLEDSVEKRASAKMLLINLSEKLINFIAHETSLATQADQKIHLNIDVQLLIHDRYQRPGTDRSLL